MSEDICRLCLSKQNLHPIFIDTEQSVSYSEVLLQTTGVKIQINDGLPQKICTDCTKSVERALELRCKSRNSETQLLQMGYFFAVTLSDSENINTSTLEKNKIIKSETKHEEMFEDFSDIYGLPNLEIEVEIDRVDDQNGGAAAPKHSRKERRGIYLSLVDGDLDPNGPVKCKICKKSVSKWSCFISHAKLHLGFKFMCEFCGKSFISSTQLKRHCRSFHGMQRELNCKYCSYLALDNAQLVLHERRVHTGVRPYICDVCAASYFSRRCLVQHLESHRTEPVVQCEKCSRSFKSRRQLARHNYSVHKGKNAHPRDRR